VATGIHHYDALIGIQKAIQNLELKGLAGKTWGVNDPLPPGQVYLREMLTERNIDLPCVMVSKAPMPEMNEIGDNLDNITGYPCMATVIAPADQEQELTSGPTLWRQRIKETFNFKQPDEIANEMAAELTLKRTEWHPVDVLDLDQFQNKNLFVSAAIIVVFVWEPARS
jgi:hypothetical protein